jgi:hypothetical protein
MALMYRACAASLLLAGLLGPAGAQGIYACVDAKGRNLTADRPIAECLDREQKELNASGTLRRKVGPSLTPQERAAEEEKARKAAEERDHLAEEKKRERALLARYPSRASHDKERATALGVVDDVIATAHKRSLDLAAQRKALEAEAALQRDRSKVPAALMRQLDEVDKQAAGQQRFLAEQDAEKKRISARFDEELGRLNVLWPRQSAPLAAVAARTVASAAAPGQGPVAGRKQP